ncbi:MAG: glycosyltransferase family 4 protein [Imperialibacter sp.]
MKVLFTASITKHVIRFHLPYLEWFQKQGFETHVACSGDEEIPFCDKKWEVPFVRTPYSIGHIKAYNVLKNLIDDQDYKLVHCHTPMAGIVTRLAARAARINGTKVLYTAHGFHFFNGASLFNWFTFYPVELYCSRLADAIIAINREDFERVSSRGFPKTAYFQIPGIGVKGERFAPAAPDEKRRLRETYGIPKDAFVLVYAAELIYRKNHHMLISAVKELRSTGVNLLALFAGRGELREDLESEVKKLKVEDSVKFLGFCERIEEIYQLSDVGVSTSRQEGLGLNLIEEMMCGLPVIATDDRGHREIVEDGLNGMMVPQDDAKALSSAIVTMMANQSLCTRMSSNAVATARKFDLKEATRAMEQIYRQFI